MQILFVHKHAYLENTLRNSLASIAERDSIQFFHTYDDAETFIQNCTIGEQQHLDLIICENNIGELSAVDFYHRITRDTGRTFSSGNCYFHTVPVVLIVDEWENRHAFLRHGFADVLNDIALERLHLYRYELASVIKEWRRRLFGELSDIGIPYERGRLQYQYYLSADKREGRYTQILADSFKKEPTRLRYDWIVTNDRQMEIAIGKLEQELKRAVRFDTRDEHAISELLSKYPVLLKRDNFSAHWREATLRRPGSRSYRLDFGLKTNFSQVYDMSVLEMKLPNDRLIVSPNFHPLFSSRVFRSIKQTNNYRRYIGDKKNHSELQRVFGFIPENVEYNVIVGRQEEKEQYIEIFNQNTQDFNPAGTNITTYDEFVQTGIDYLARRDFLSII